MNKMKNLFNFDSETRSAIISENGLYRYKLERIWDINKPKVMFIMLNPSKADASIDDPTIRRCVSFAKSWGYGGILVGNLFAYRSTYPKELLSAKDPIGPDNINHLRFMYLESELIICAWGNANIIEKLNIMDYKPLSGIVGRLSYLELSKDGTPKHPLYLKGNTQPHEFKISFFNAIGY